jgi:hypothetical protein
MATHRMILTVIYPNGEEEWWCPLCERRIFVYFYPAYRKIILDVGNHRIDHIGGEKTNNLVDDDFKIPRLIEPESKEIIKYRLKPEIETDWVKWLEAMDFENLWNNKNNKNNKINKIL